MSTSSDEIKEVPKYEPFKVCPDPPRLYFEHPEVVIRRNWELMDIRTPEELSAEIKERNIIEANNLAEIVAKRNVKLAEIAQKELEREKRYTRYLNKNEETTGLESDPRYSELENKLEEQNELREVLKRR